MTDNVIPFPSREDLANRLQGLEFAEWVFTNDKTNPYPVQILHTFYEGVFKNKIGIMHVKDSRTGEIETVLVGVDVLDNGTADCYPLAKVFKHDEAAHYLTPDGEGNWIGEVTNDAADGT